MVLKSTTYQDFPKRNHNIKHSVLWTTWSDYQWTKAQAYFCSFTANHGNCSSSFFFVLQFPYFWTNEPIKISLKAVSHVVSSDQNRDTVQTRSYWTSDRKHGFLKTKLLHLLRLTVKRHQLICTANAHRHVKRTHRGMSVLPNTAVSCSCCWNINIHDGPACAAGTLTSMTDQHVLLEH